MRLILFLCASIIANPVGAAEPKLLLTWGKKGDKAGEFSSPIGLAFNKADELYVTDVNNARVQKFDKEGKHLGMFDLPRDAPERKQCVIGGIAIDTEGRVYLSFMTKHRISVYTSDGKFIREWGRSGSGDGEFNQPGGLVFRADGTLLVCDQCNHRVQHFTVEGKYLGQWGKHGKEPGQFDGLLAAGSRFGGPHFLAQDSKGRLYTTEGVRGRVQQFNGDGKPMVSWGSKGDEPGGFGAHQLGKMTDTMGPIGVFVDQQDRVWVSSLNDRVQAFSTEGKFLFGIGTRKDDPIELLHPHGMAVDSKGRFYLADSGHQRILKFELPK